MEDVPKAAAIGVSARSDIVDAGGGALTFSMVDGDVEVADVESRAVSAAEVQESRLQRKSESEAKEWPQSLMRT